MWTPVDFPAEVVARGTLARTGLDGPLRSLLATPVWSDAAVKASGLPISGAPVVSVGGGLASFALVDFMRICDVPTDEIRVVSPQRHPYQNMRYLIHRSQIQDNDPLRSDSVSRMDNIWGFPSYAVDQAIQRRSLAPLLTVLGEPLVTEFFNPAPDQVFRGIDREAARIGWPSMVMPGWVRVVRKREGGGYFSLVCPADGGPPVVLLSRYVHIGTGHPAINCSEQAVDYRIRHNDFFSVVNAYEPHEHVYQVLRRRAATVVIRGAGITASRVLERLLADRAKHGNDIRIIHLFRTYVDGSKGPLTFRRPGGDGWGYQAFSFPKAAGPGQLRRRMAGMDSDRRAEFIKAMGGTTTAKRRAWQRQLRLARVGGYYRAFHGDVRDMAPTEDGRVELRVDVAELPAITRMEVDFVIDCTGLRMKLGDNPLLADLLDTGGARCNPMGGLDVGPNFEVLGTDQDPGRIYASGTIARGGYLAPVDSFWGFSYAALMICDDLARRGFCSRLGVTRSVSGWLKWLGGVTP